MSLRDTCISCSQMTPYGMSKEAFAAYFGHWLAGFILGIDGYRPLGFPNDAVLSGWHTGDEFRLLGKKFEDFKS